MSPQFVSIKDVDLHSLLQGKFTNEFRSGYINIDGVCLPEYYLKFSDAIENLKVHEDDVWVCSFPKTGTTWTQEMVWCIANDLDFERAKVVLHERFPFLELSPLFDYTKLLSRTSSLHLPESILNSVKYIDEMSSPRFIKSHLPFNLLPKQIRTGEKKPKIIYVARNPKDTCVSYYHHCKLLEGYCGDFNEFCSLFIGGKLCFAPFWDHILSFWIRRDHENLLFITYEDMKNNLANVISKTAVFLRKSLKNNEIEILQDHLSFTSMKVNPAVNYEEVVEFNKKFKLTEVDGQFIRSGKINQWKENMSREMIARFDDWTKINSNEIGFFF